MKLIIMFLIAIFFSKTSLATTCIAPHMDAMIWSTPIIFKGKVVSSGKSESKFEIIDLYKGDFNKTVDVSGVYDIGREYFIFAGYGKDGKIYSRSYCGSGTHKIKTLAEWGDRWWEYRSRLERGYILAAKASAYRDVDKLIRWRKLERESGKDATGAYHAYTEKNDFLMALKVRDRFGNILFEGRPDRVAENKAIYVYLLAETGQLEKAYKKAKEYIKEYPDNEDIQQHYAWLLFYLGREKELPKEISSFARISVKNDIFNYANEKIKKVSFYECKLYMVSFENSEIHTLDIEGSQAHKQNFSKAVVDSLVYKDVDSVGDNFSDSTIARSWFISSRIENAIFDNAKINMSVNRTQFVDSSFRNTVLDRSEFKIVNLSNVDLVGASFKGADLSKVYTFDKQGVDFSSVIFDENTIWPENFDINTMTLMPISDLELLKEEKDRVRFRSYKRRSGYWGKYHEYIWLDY